MAKKTTRRRNAASPGRQKAASPGQRKAAPPGRRKAAPPGRRKAVSPRRRKAASPRLFDRVLGSIILGLFRLIRLAPSDAMIAFAGRAAELLGPLTSRHAVGSANLRRAFPDLSEAEYSRILKGAWNSLGRIGAEYAFLDRIFDYDPDNPSSGRIEVVGEELFKTIQDSKEPAIFFTAHMANWELLAICASKFDLDVTSLFRPPNNATVAREVDRIRTSMMGSLIPSRAGASYALNGVLEKGGRVGLLVDQFFKRGTNITFFGLDAPTNPLLAILTKRFDCPVYGARTIRLPGGRFRLELTGPLDLPRDADGHINSLATMQAVTDIVESWVREYPEQWLWFHRRWTK